MMPLLAASAISKQMNLLCYQKALSDERQTKDKMLEMNFAWETFYFVSSVCLAGLNYMDKVSKQGFPESSG